MAENAPLGTAPAAPGITRPTPGRRRAPRVVRAGTPVSQGVRSVLTAARLLERPRTRALLIDDEAGSGSETTAHDIEKLSVSVRTHRRSPPAPRPASHAGRAPPCARMRDLATIESPGGAAQPALARGADGAVPVLCRLDIICARWVLCGRAASVRPPHHRPRESIWVAEAGRRLAAQQVWHRDGALWHHFSSSLTAVSGTSQYRCHSVPRSGPACPCWGCDLTEGPSGGGEAVSACSRLSRGCLNPCALVVW